MARNGDKRRFFEVSVHQDNIKAFSTSLHLLQKIGKEMTLEMEGSTLTLRALNDTKSAFGAVEFSESYFDSFELASTLKTFSCKVNVKPVCVIFRSLKGMKLLRIRAGMADSSEHELVFEIVLTNDITRTYRFRYQDCEVMSAVFDEDAGSFLRAKPKLFVQLLNHIYQSPEICMEAGADFFSVKSFHKANDGVVNAEGAPPVRFMSTGLSVSIQEFEQYEYTSAARSEELIFCVKEVNAFLGYSEILDIPDFDLFFSGSGRAIKYSARHDSFTASLILATIESAQRRLQGPSGGGNSAGVRMQVDPEHEQPVNEISVLEDEEGPPSAAAAPQLFSGGDGDYSQPVTAFRRHPPRTARSSGAFSRYTAAGDEEEGDGAGKDADGEGDGDGDDRGGEEVRGAMAGAGRRSVFLEAGEDWDRGNGSGEGSGSSGHGTHRVSRSDESAGAAERVAVNPIRRKRFLDEDSDEG